jgi:hypothetical protein
VGIVFGVSVIPILLWDLYRVLAGKLRDDELRDDYGVGGARGALEELDHELHQHAPNAPAPAAPPPKKHK